jgi:hypothetical protein
MSFQWVKNPDDVRMGFFYDNVLLLEISNENYNKSHVGTNAGEKAIKNYIESLTVLNVIQNGNIRLLKDIEQQNNIEKLFFESAENAIRAAAASAASASALAANAFDLAAAFSSAPVSNAPNIKNLSSALEELKSAEDKYVESQQAADKYVASQQAAEEAAEKAAEEAGVAEKAAEEAEEAEEEERAAKKPNPPKRQPSERAAQLAAKVAAKVAAEATAVAAKVAAAEAAAATAAAERATAKAKAALITAAAKAANQAEVVSKTKLLSTASLEDFKNAIKAHDPKLLKLPSWTDKYGEEIKKAVELAMIYNYADQAHDIKNIKLFSLSRVRAAPLAVLARLLPDVAESNIEKELHKMFSESLRKRNINATYEILKKNDPKIKILQDELSTKEIDDKVLRFQDGGGYSAQQFSAKKACATLCGQFDACKAISKPVKTKGEFVEFDDVDSKFKMKYECKESNYIKRTITINNEEIECATEFSNLIICCASAGVSAALHGLERYHTLNKKELYTVKGADDDEAKLIKLITGHMYRCRDTPANAGGCASQMPGSGNGRPPNPTTSTQIFNCEINCCDKYVDEQNYKNLIPIAKIVLALTRESLKKYTGDIEDYKKAENHLRWELMATIGRLKSYGDIHYLSEALLRCKLQNKPLFMTTVDRGVAGLTQHLASLMGIEATIIVQLGIQTDKELHVFKCNPNDNVLKGEDCYKLLNIVSFKALAKEWSAASAAAGAAAGGGGKITNKRADEYRKWEENPSRSPIEEDEYVRASLLQPPNIDSQVRVAEDLDDYDKTSCAIEGDSGGPSAPPAPAPAPAPPPPRGRSGGLASSFEAAGSKFRHRTTRKHRPRKTRKRNRKQRKTRKV